MAEQGSADIPTTVSIRAVDEHSTATAYAGLFGVDAGLTYRVEGVHLRVEQAASTHRVVLAADDARRRLIRRRGVVVHDGADGVDDLDGRPSFGLYTGAGDENVETVATDIVALDHLVFTSTDRNDAVAFLSGTLGFDLRLDQTVFDGLRQLFFRTPDGHIAEVVIGHPEHQGKDPLALWGLAWRSADIEVTHRRVRDSGLDVSDIRDGRKSGTKVFSVRDRTLGLPTLVIGHSGGLS